MYTHSYIHTYIHKYIHINTCTLLTPELKTISNDHYHTDSCMILVSRYGLWFKVEKKVRYPTDLSMILVSGGIGLLFKVEEKGK